MAQINQNELNQCELMLKNLLNIDNNIRRGAETQLQKFLQDNKSKELLSLYASQILLTSTDLSVCTYCAILIRKIFIVNEDQISNDITKFFSKENKQLLKNNILNALINTKNKNLRKKISNAIINVFISLKENEEKWDEFLKFIINNFYLEFNESNIDKFELSLYLLSNIYSEAYEELKEGIPIFLKCFNVYFQSNNISLKAKTVECINELLCSSLEKKEVKQFKEFIFYILQTTLFCLENKDNENLKICLESLNDLANSEPKILRKNFNDIFILMGKIIENKQIDDYLREISFEILISIIEQIPKCINKDNEKIKQLISGIFKYSMEIDNSIDEDWLKPESETYITDEFIPEEKLDESTSLISRLFTSLDKEIILNIVSENISELIQHSNEKEWKYKYIAYITIAEISKFINEITNIEKIINMIILDLNNPNPKIQYSSIYCIAELSDHHFPDFQNEYHKKVIPLLIEIMKNSNCLRIQLEICDAIDMFIDHISESDIGQYMQNSLDVLLQVFLKDNNISPIALKEGILIDIQQFIVASEESFKNYSEKTFEILLNYLTKILNEGINKNLIGILLETISLIGPLCPNLFKKVLLNLFDILIKIQMNLNSYKENLGNYLLNTWDKIIDDLLEINKDKIIELFQSLIILLKKPPEMSIANNPNETINIQDFFKDENEEKEEEKKTRKKKSIQTSETEEFNCFLEILNLLLKKAPKCFNLNHIQIIYQIAVNLLKYPNENIQEEISKTYDLSINVLSEIKVDKNILHSTSKQYIIDLVNQLFIEKDFGLITTMLDSLNLIVKTTKKFLSINEINDLFEKLFQIFDKVEQNRISLNKQKIKTENEIENNKKTGANKIYSDDEDDNSEEEAIDEIKDQIEEIEDIQTSFSDLFGNLFDTHKELTLEIVDKFINNYLPKYFNENSSNFEKKLGLMIIDNMIEYLQQNLLIKIWDNLFNILIQFSNNLDYELRNAAAYGLGIFAKFTNTNFISYKDNLLKAIINSLNYPKNIPKNEKKYMKFAKDNSVSALCKVIQYHGKELDNLNNYLQIWIDNMPITEDLEEGLINNKFLMEILMKEPNLILGDNYKNLEKIIIIIGKSYKTEGSDDETNNNMIKFTEVVKGNNDMKEILQKLFNTYKKGKTLNKIKNIFKNT